MADVLVIIGAAILIIQAFIGLALFVTSIGENEKRASVFGGIQFTGMLALVHIFFCLLKTGFFDTGAGLILLTIGVIAAAFAAFMLMRKNDANPRALQGTKGLIIGKVKRYDERKIVFSRNNYLEPETENYEKFYKEHPEYEERDAKRRAV